MASKKPSRTLDAMKALQDPDTASRVSGSAADTPNPVVNQEPPAEESAPQVPNSIPNPPKQIVSPFGPAISLEADNRIYPDNIYEPIPTELLDKANKLAEVVWGPKENYLKAKMGLGVDNPEERAAVEKENNRYFPSYGISNEVREILIVKRKTYYPSNRGGFGSDISYLARDLVKRLKKLERKGEEILSDEDRDRIINDILMPIGNYGYPAPWFYNPTISLGFPPPKVVVNELLKTEDMQLISDIVNYIQHLRLAFKEIAPGKSFSIEDLLVNLGENIHKRITDRSYAPHNDYSRSRPISDAKFVATLRAVHEFFLRVIPTQVVEDFIPGLRYPRRSNQSMERMQKSSIALRTLCLNFIQEEKTLSELLEAILNLSDDVISYFLTLGEEVNEVINFLNRAGISYPKLVEDSASFLAQNLGEPF